MRSVFSFVVAALAAVASAQSQPSGNSIIKPGLNEQVPAGKPFSITWQPTTKGPITLILLRGPSTNVVPIATIVSGIPNSGHYEWTPSESLEPDTTHYGIKLVVDATGQYQYSTQFGISGSMGKKHTTTATTHHTATQTATATEHHKTTTSCPTSTPHHTKTHTMTTHSPTKHVTLATTTTSAAAVASTGGFNASQASISPQPSSAGAERLGGMVGGAMAGAAAVALFAL